MIRFIFGFFLIFGVVGGIENTENITLEKSIMDLKKWMNIN